MAPPFTTRSFLLLPFALSFVLADVEFITPAAGAKIPVGAINVSWKESGRPPVIEELSQYTLSVMVGGNNMTNMLPLATLVAGGYFSNGSTVSGTIQAGVSGPVTNGFFLRITSTDRNGGWIENYSDRFTITGLTGTVASQYLNAAKALDGDTDGPPRSGNVPAITSSSISVASSTSTSTTSSPQQTVTVTSGAQSDHTPAAQSKSGDDRGPTMGAIAGIVVGVLVAISAAIAFIIWALIRRRRQDSRRLSDDLTDLDGRVAPKQLSVTSLSELSAEGRVMELGDGQPPPEMDSTTVRAELEGDTYQPATPHSNGTSLFEPTPLTPVAPSVFEGTLENPFDLPTYPATPTNRI